jgi:hypothetical protein
MPNRDRKGQQPGANGLPTTVPIVLVSSRNAPPDTYRRADDVDTEK